MKILFYRYGSICEPDYLEAFQKLNIEVVEEKSEISNKNITPAQCVELVSKVLEVHNPVFVFSINFYPAIAKVCNLYRTAYLCQTVDSPVAELFMDAIKLDTNRIFLFDKAQYQLFSKYNKEHIYHLPLASAVERFDKVICSINEKDRKKFENDISFVGSLYTEKNPLHKIKDLSEYAKGYIKGIVEASMMLPGYNLIEDALSNEVIEEIREKQSDFFSAVNLVAGWDRYLAAHEYVGMQVSEEERIRTLNTLAQFFDVHLYTRSDSRRLKNVRIHEGIRTLDEMPKAFHLSKINLNITIKPIQTGLPLRVFDILGCGGFLMTNYQQELTEIFTVGEDLECYGSIEELVEKCDYYLKHEDERIRIAVTGYEKVKKYHTYTHRIASMLRTIT